MSKTSIEWATHTWNPLAAFHRETGKRGWFCTRVSDGCKNCYAAVINVRLGNGLDYQLRNLSKIEWRLVNLDEPLRARKPRRYFVNSMTDLFHEDVPDGMIAQVFAVMAGAQRHRFLILTKRPERMADLLTRDFFWANVHMFGMEQEWDMETIAMLGQIGTRDPLPNVWLGTSVEDQQRADERIPHLLRTPAAVRFLSCEPLLGPLDLTSALTDGIPTREDIESARGLHYIRHGVPQVDWVIVGGESGPGARPFDIGWAQSLIEQCRYADVACFVKQLGSAPAVSESELFGLTKSVADGYRFLLLRDSKGGEMEEWPEHLRVREFPQVMP